MHKVHFRMFRSSFPRVSAVPNCPAVPHTMTAEVISWRTSYPDDDSVFPLERFYSEKEREAYIKVANRNALAQEDINEAWKILEGDKVNLELMLTSWAKRHRERNSTVHTVPSVAFAEKYIATDPDFHGEMGTRARDFIQRGYDSRGDKFFKD